jgi:two-component system, cell cycle sensor histidine kinase and response regulator CckA
MARGGRRREGVTSSTTRDTDPEDPQMDVGAGRARAVEIADLQAELDAARARERRLLALLRCATDSFTVFGSDGSLHWAPDLDEPLLSEPTGAPSGTSVFAAVHPDDRERVEAAVARAASQPGVRQPPVEYRLVGQDGTVYEVESRLAGHVDDPAVGGVIGATRDISSRRAAERALRESDARLRAAVERSLDAWVVLRVVRAPDGEPVDLVVLDANEAAGALLSAAPASLGGRRLLDVIPSASGFLRRVIDIVESGRAIESEGAVPAPQLGAAWLQYQIVPLGDDVAVIARDVSDRHAAADALRRSEERLRAAIGGGFDGFAILEAVHGAGDAVVDFRFVEVNTPLAAMLSATPAELIGRGLLEIEPSQRDHGLIAAYRLVYRSGEPLALDWESFGTTSFRAGWFETHVVPLSEGVAVALRDITEAKRAERALRESERAAIEAAERAQALIQAAPITIVERSSDGRILQWNPATEELFGWTAEEMVGQPLPGIPEGSAPAQEGLGEALSQGERFTNLEVERYTKDGRLVRLLLSVAPLFDSKGQMSGTISFGTDITEQEQVEERLRHAQKMEAIGRVAGGLAHDFNNLLTTILGNCELLGEELEPESPLWTSLDDILHASQRAARLADQMLTIGRRQARAPVIMDLNAIVTTMRSMVRRAIPEDVDIVLDLDPSLAPVEADPAQIEQVLLNLVLNARDAMPSGGMLVVRTDVPPPGALARAGARPRGNPGWVRLQVQDTGEGMDAATLERIFEPFFTTKPRGRGTGLGLPTVYGVVTQSGGYITVDSTPGEGSSFDVHLPAAAAKAATATVEPAPAAPSTATAGTILLVEDDASVRSLAQRALERAGYDVLVAQDGLEAVAVADAHPGGLDLLVTDVVMPGMRGPEVARRLRLAQPDLRVLFVSGYAEDALGPDGVLAFGAFLAKPFRTAELVARVAEVLGGDDR